MRTRMRRVASFVVLAGVVLVVASCGGSGRPQSTLDPKGTYAHKIQNLVVPVFITAGIVGLIVFAAVIVAVFRFRERPGHEHTPKQIHGRPALEISLTILPAIILAVVAVPTIKTLFELNQKPKDPLVVNVIGQQWWWEFDYPTIKGSDGLPLVTANEMVVPAGRPVRVNVTSRDVIHSFWIPKLNGKRDAVPGRIQPWNIQADKPGEYWGQCTEFCGLSHANMRMRLIALTPADFDEWVANQQQAATDPTEDLATAGQAQFKSLCASCHQVNGLKDAQGQQIVAQPETQVYSGSAPNLTHLMSRGTFASGNFDLLNAACRAERDKLSDSDPTAFSASYLKGTTPECLNQPQLEAWLRNPPSILPEFVNPTKLAATDGKYRGMPNLNLTETQIDQLVAYLKTLK